MSFQDFFNSKHWNVVDVLKTEPRPAELLPVDDLPLTGASRAFLETLYPNGIYRHQKLALAESLAGKNVCMVTGTASGKSLVFQTAAIDLLAKDPNARIMAIYPMKALGNEQRDRWQSALIGAGLGDATSVETLVGRIDGNVPQGFRMNILERARIIVFTPDIIHAWLFSNLNQPGVINFLRQVQLMVVDEVHAYSGVFGSNAGFLFRRLEHLLALLGVKPRYICASATIAQPAAHLRSLFGKEFSIVGPDQDTSPRFPLDVYLVDPPGSERFLNEVVQLLEYLTHADDPSAADGLSPEGTRQRFIAFVDSRKQVELISSILNRLLRETAKAAEEQAAGEAQTDEAGKVTPPRGRRWGGKTAKAAEVSDEPDVEGEVTGVLQNLNVLPYRAGYEDHDRRQIQERLTEGTLNGVVSTSALELGIDIPHLNICVLIGVPGSATSLQQRIGRIGRHGPGTVIVVNGGDVHDQAVFSHPQSFFQRPLAESALYLENEHIQYIHALCLARTGGEHDQVLEAAAKINAKSAVAYARRATQPFDSPVDWPENFLALCRKERAGQTPRHLTSLKMEAHERPNYTFPLRDVESQFKVERRDGPNVSSMGSMSFAQLMREAYPGAIYYYATLPYRVTKVNVKTKVITVRREKRYTTQPQKTLPAVFPRLSPGGVDAASRMDGLLSLEASLLVRESIRGIIEQRGRNEAQYPYPLAREMGFFQDQPYFSRNYFTTGVVLSHPALAGEGADVEALAAILYESFMLTIPFERQDIGFAADHFRQTRFPIGDAATGGSLVEEGRPFITIYDQIYGSLRLSSRLLNPATLGQVLAEAVLLAGRQAALKHNRAALDALLAMTRAVFTNPQETLRLGLSEAAAQAGQRDPETWERVVMPGSKGLMVRTNEEFHVLRILNTPAGLSYEGTPASMLGTGASMMPLLSDVADVPGESQVGWYEIATGALEPASLTENAVTVTPGETTPPPEVDAGWLRRILSVYFEPPALQRLAQLCHVKAGGDKPALIEALTSASLSTGCPTGEVLDRALAIYLDQLETEA